MKVRGVVSNVDDPMSLGRIKARIIGYTSPTDETPWSYPCSVMAGPGYGFFCLPIVGDEVYLEQTSGGEWVWLGFCWSVRSSKPSDGTATVRVFRTPVGHQIKIDEAGDIKLEHSNGSFMVMKQNGDIEVTATGNILLNDNGTCKAVNTESICMYTGTPHPQGSKTVYTEKP
jgi:hypothetical protein